MGGYNNVAAQKLQYVMALFAVLCALPVPFVNSFYLVAALFWGLLFFGGFVLPTITGIMINTVPPNQKSSANSLANLAYNLFGYLPAPSIYGAISSTTKQPRIAMGTIMYTTLIIEALLVYGIRRKLREEEFDQQRARSESMSIAPR